MKKTGTNGVQPRLAVIGCGDAATQLLIPSLRRIGWDPRVLADPSPARCEIAAAKLSRRARSALRVTNWKNGIDQFDAAIVAVPHSLHGPTGMDLLNAGKHVFMEKPLATSADSCRELVALAERRRLVLAVGLMRRYLHVAQWIKALIASGRLGEIRTFSVREGSIFKWGTSDSFLRPEAAGGGVLMDTGAHTIDLMLWWLGSVSSLRYRDDSYGGVEGECLISCELESGAVGTVELSRSRRLRNSAYIEGAQGYVEVALHENKILSASPHVLEFEHESVVGTGLPEQRSTELFDAELTDFRSSVVEGVQLGVPGRQGVRSVELIQRCYAAREALTAPWADRRLPAQREREHPRMPPGSVVVITGATGFVGGRLAERLVEQGAHVRCLVRDLATCARLARLPVEIVRADLSDRSAVSEALRGVGYVFHCAYDGRSERSNIEGVRSLLAAAIEHSVGRFVHVSSFSVYEPFPDGELSEDTRDGDRGSTYVRNKLDLEREVMLAARSQGIAATVVQPSIVYGPFCRPWTDDPAEMLLYGTVILPEGDGMCNPIYIDDLVDGMVVAAQHPAACADRFILAGPETVGWGEFYRAFARALGAAPPVSWPASRIAKENSGFVRGVRLALKNPIRFIDIVLRWDAARRVLQAGLDALPAGIQKVVYRRYFGAHERRVGEVVLPDPQLLALYSAKVRTSSEKARKLLGLRPVYTFSAGMELTGEYLQWAFGDTARSLLERSEGPVDREVAGADSV